MTITRTINGQAVQFELTANELFEALTEMEHNDLNFWLTITDIDDDLTKQERDDIASLYHGYRNMGWTEDMSSAYDEVISRRKGDNQ